MAISSNSVIHYTRTLENLKGILTERKFFLKYCTDYVHIKGDLIGQYELAVPMVSFCDIPFTEVHKLTNEYGPYGIGLSKKWAIKKRLNPVLYCEASSNLTQVIDSIYYLTNSISNYTEEEHTEYNAKQLQEECEKLLGYVKNYQNISMNIGKVPANYKFYDEREWRYVPSKEDMKIQGVDLELLIPKEDFEDKKEIFNNKAKQFSLEFDETDITYIIVNKKTEVADMINFMKTIGIKTPELCTKLISLEQIEEDF